MSGVDLTLSFCSIPEELGSAMVGRCSPKSLDKLAQVSHEMRLLANQTALDRLNRSFGGAMTSLSHAKELYRRSVQWNSTIVEEAYAKLGIITAALQTEKTCVVSIQSPFLPHIREMLILSPPKWEATFPLENSVAQIISFQDGCIIVFTQTGNLEKYVLKQGKIRERFLGTGSEILPVVGVQVPFIFVLSLNNTIKVLDALNFRCTCSFVAQREAKAIFHVNSQYILFFKDGYVSNFILDSGGYISCLEEPCRNFFSPLTQFKSVSSTLLETHFTVDTDQGTGLFFYDHMNARIRWMEKDFSFEKMIRIQEFLLGLHQNTIYFEAVFDHKTFRLFSPKQGTIIDFCPSEEGMLRILVQQSNRIVLFRLIFPPYKKPFMDSDS